jgi:hypothetical protein
MNAPDEKTSSKLAVRKIAKRVFWTCLFIVVVQFGTYFWYAESIIPRTGIRNLSDYGLLKGRKYIVTDARSWSTNSPAQREVLLTTLRQFTNTIYHSMDEVPDSDKVFIATTEDDKAHYADWKARGVDAATVAALGRELALGRRVVGLKDGIQVGCVIQAQGLFWMKCNPSHWVSMLGGEGRSDVYIWVLGFWVRVYNVYSYMS